jgi:hypothetical protein
MATSPSYVMVRAKLERSLGFQTQEEACIERHLGTNLKAISMKVCLIDLALVQVSKATTTLPYLRRDELGLSQAGGLIS